MIPSLAAPLAEARKRGEIEPVVEAVGALKPNAQPAAYNHAIRQLWDSYERPLAIELIKVLVENHSSALIAQYWLQHAMQVEPQMARDQISREFLKIYFQPEVAASCGPVG
jgi:hypothetical protein